MRRSNIFKPNPGKEEEAIMLEWADNCSRMFNEINYKRRQSFFDGEIDWNTDELYHEYKKLIGSGTAQQLINKNNEAWKSFFALLKKWKADKLGDKPPPPGYWKDRTTKKRILRVLIRSDLYKLGRKYLKLPFKFKVRWKGKNRWKGKTGQVRSRL
jgi:putative transposase